MKLKVQKNNRITATISAATNPALRKTRVINEKTKKKEKSWIS